MSFVQNFYEFVLKAWYITVHFLRHNNASQTIAVILVGMCLQFHAIMDSKE